MDSGEAMCVLLRKEGVRVDWAASGEEALARYGVSHHPAFDAIMLDLMLPDMDGATLIARGRSRASRGGPRARLSAATIQHEPAAKGGQATPGRRGFGSMRCYRARSSAG